MVAGAQSYASSVALDEGLARAELFAHPACRLHARLRQRGAKLLCGEAGPLSKPLNEFRQTGR
jgi:hypothetical protein